LRKTLPLLILLFSGCAYYNAFYNAKKYYNEGLELKKKGNKAYMDKFRKSAEKCEKVIAWYPNSRWMDDAIYLLGLNFYEQDQFDRAERKFRELLEYYPDSPFAPWSYLYLGKIYIKRGKVSDAMFYLTMAKKSGDKKVIEEVTKEELKVYLEDGEHEKVINLGNEYIKKYPAKKEEIMKLIADAYLSKGDTTRAMLYYRKTMGENTPDSLKIKLGEIYMEKNMSDSTISLLKGINNPDAKILLAKAYVKIDNPDSAIACIEEIARIRRDKYSLISNILLSEIYQARGDTAGMMKALKKAKGLSVDDPLKEFALRKYNYYADLERSKTDSTFNDSILAEDLYLYAEALYLYAGKPDEAIRVFLKLEREYPEFYLRKKSMFARAYLYLNYLHDTLSALKLLDTITTFQDTSIYVKKARELLNEIQKDTTNSKTTE